MLKSSTLSSEGIGPRIEDFADPIQFCSAVLKFTPYAYQLAFLEAASKFQFVVLRWCRQSGKSWIVASFLLWFAIAHKGIHIAIVSPSFKQSKRIITRIAGFLGKLPRGFARPLKTTIRIANGAHGLQDGSIIEAFANNPDTIRGPTVHLIYADEMGFIANDEELYDAILFALGATNGKFIASSTPWNRDSLFYKMCFDEGFTDFKRLHVAWKAAVKPDGPLSPTILEKIKKQLAPDPWRWQREMEAEFSEDEDAWLPQSLITKCIDSDADYIEQRLLTPTMT
jgi:phage terminase large subunit-like protein